MAERLFKFLAAGSVGRFSGFAWPVGQWVSAAVEPCVSGVHVCRPEDLAYWLDDELWELEGAGARVEHYEKLVVERARLVSRVEAWPEPLAGDLALDCLGELRRLVARELSGDPDEAELDARDDRDAARAARDLAGRDRPTRTASAARLLTLFADAGEIVADSTTSPAAAGRYVAYIAAYAADRTAPEPGRRLQPGVTPFAEERRRQAALLGRWLDVTKA